MKTIKLKNGVELNFYKKKSTFPYFKEEGYTLEQCKEDYKLLLGVE